MLEEAPRKTISSDLLPEEKLLVDAFYRAQVETAPLPGVTVDIREVASKAVRAYWDARELGRVHASSETGTVSPMDLPLFRTDVLKAVFARIDPVWEFVRELVSTTVPTLAGVVILTVGYAYIKGVNLPTLLYLPKLPYLIAAAFAVSALALTVSFMIRRDHFIGSRWRVLHTSTGSVVGGLIVGTMAIVIGSYSLHQQKKVIRYEERVDTYQEEVRLNTAINEIQPIAASVLSDEEPKSSLEQIVDSGLWHSMLAEKAQIKKMSSEGSQQVTYEITYNDKEFAKLTNSLKLVFTRDRVNIIRNDKVEYTILQSSIEAVNENHITLGALSFGPTLNEPMLVPTFALFNSNEETNQTKLLGQKVMVTYDVTLDKLTNVSLLHKPYLSNLYSAEFLPARIERLNGNRESIENASMTR